MISILITLLVIALIFGLCMFVLNAIPLASPYSQIARAILALIFIIILLYWLLPMAHLRLQ